MGKAGKSWVMGVALALAIAPFSAQADGQGEREPGTGDKGTDMVLDLLILRPLGLLTAGVGSALFVVSLPFTLPSGSAGDAACELVAKPLAYTFTRPLGDIEDAGGHCRDGARR